MASSALLVAIIGLFCIQIATASNITRCFVCMSPGQPECEDEFDITLGNSIQCNSLPYTRTFIPPLATDLPLDDIERSERLSNTTVIQYYCVKLAVQYQNGTNGMIRSCHQHVDNIAEVCEFITVESSIGLSRSNVSSIKQCNACNDRDDCNSSASISASIVMVLVAMLLTRKY
ncbi:hypothetical protein Trydic_g3159 [Trypoxylus dichotomus]